MHITAYSDKYKEQTIKLIFDILENEFGRHSKSGRPDLFNIPKVYQTGSGNFWLAIEKEKVVGTIGLHYHGDGRGYLERFYVAKELRRKGVGSKLFLTLLKFAKKSKYKKIYLSTWDGTPAANNFYIKNGFKRIEALPKDLLPQSSHDNVFYEMEL
jgi:ribosomal protein S18 acetylase RimI-like enzyme